MEEVLRCVNRTRCRNAWELTRRDEFLALIAFFTVCTARSASPFSGIAWNGSNEIGRKELGRPFWSNNLGRIDWGRIGSNGIGSKSICCLPRTWHFSRSTQVHSTQFRNGEDSTHGTGGRFYPFLSTHFRSPHFLVERKEVEPFDRIAGIDWNAVEFDRTGRKRSLFASSRLTIIMWGICCVCTLVLTVAKTSSHYDRFAISVPARSLLLFDLA